MGASWSAGVGVYKTVYLFGCVCWFDCVVSLLTISFGLQLTYVRIIIRLSMYTRKVHMVVRPRGGSTLNRGILEKRNMTKEGH